MKRLFVAVFLLIQIGATSQNTLGLLTYEPAKSYDGLNLIYPHNQSTVYLLNNCGAIVHSWVGEEGFRPGNTAYLLDDGRLIKTVRSASVAQDPIWAPGGGASIEIRSWDNELEWSYTLNDSMARLHHDIAVIPQDDGIHILALAWEKKGIEELVAVGRDTTVLEREELWPDYIFEIDPSTEEIVWEWHAWDHLIQDFDSTAANFGSVADHPNKIDINYDFDGSGDADWMHSNAIDFDPINNQILLSVPNFHEIWIIDHSTSTEQAASDRGGLSQRGGDLMYRWGNPAAYASGDAEDQDLFYQHDAHFIRDFVSPIDPNYGKIALFNNRVGSDYSTVNILDPKFDMYDWAFIQGGNLYEPQAFDLEKVHPIDSSLMWSTGLSSVQLLPNSNLLICVGRFGYSYEMTPDNEIVWEYITPLRGGAALPQGDTSLTINNNLTFRTKRYPLEYAAFTDRDLSEKGWIETNEDESFCASIVPVEDLYETYGLTMFPNPADQMLTLSWEAGIYVDVEIFGMSGRPVLQEMKLTGGRKYIDTREWPEGVYIIRINRQESGRFVVTH